jgi:hypothetical protein
LPKGRTKLRVPLAAKALKELLAGGVAVPAAEAQVMVTERAKAKTKAAKVTGKAAKVTGKAATRIDWRSLRGKHTIAFLFEPNSREL